MKLRQIPSKKMQSAGFEPGIFGSKEPYEDIVVDLNIKSLTGFRKYIKLHELIIH